MINSATQATVLRLHSIGESSRRIANTLKIARKTVKRVIRRGTIVAERAVAAEISRPWHRHIMELSSIVGITASDCRSKLLDEGFSIPRSTFTRFCRKHGIHFDGRGRLDGGQSSPESWLSRLIHGALSNQDLAKELPSTENVDYLLDKMRTGSLVERKKASTILTRRKGIANLAVARALHSSPKTTRAYWDRYMKRGLVDLFGPRAESSGSAVKKATRTKRILELFHHKPKNFGINRTSWSQLTLAIAYEARFNESISRGTIGRSLREMKFTWQKAKRVLTSPDPEYREKVEILLAKLHSLRADEEFFFLDELGPLNVKKRGGRVYVLKENGPVLLRRQISKGTVSLLAALSATTNQMTWIFSRSKDTLSIIDLIELLFNQHEEKKTIYITWDAVSWHNSIALTEWLDVFNEASRDNGAGAIIEVVPLPTSSQFLNVIEGVFSGLMRAVVHNSDYQSEEEMKLAISEHLQERNLFFRENPKRVGKKIWEADFFGDYDSLRSGSYIE